MSSIDSNHKREFKFRAWDENDSQMLSWKDIEEDFETENYYQSLFLNDHYHTLQFTGAQDMYGYDIYEFDIVSINGKLKLVEFKDFSWYFGQMPFWYINIAKKVQIVGNLYENPSMIVERYNQNDK